jgi:hypothetical protein
MLAWVRTLEQPKHLVLTSRNQAVLTKHAISVNLRGVAAIRRRKLARGWKSGCWTMELTNEGRGWHLHFHLLIETRWIPIEVVSVIWASYVGQEDAAIVKVKDARHTDYLREVAKYVVKSSELSSWSGLDIAQVMDAFRGRRSFGVFGEAAGRRAEWKRAVAEARRERAKCECGCNTWQVEPLAHGLTRQELRRL